MEYFLPSTDKLLTRRRFLQEYLGGAALLVLPTLSSCSNEEGEPTAERYPKHDTVATVFWVGESASEENADISNTSTEWDTDAPLRFGGVDDPEQRDENGLPSTFNPLHNPCYIALPASEFDEDGLIPGAREASPWESEAKQLEEDQSLFKGRWVKVTNPNTGEIAYGQWLDTGPSDDASGSMDYEYVFGAAQPKNNFNQKAGIDVSPTLAHLLNIKGSAKIIWQFVDAEDVPQDGLWSQFPPITKVIYR